jgi:hypothetical protein
MYYVNCKIEMCLFNTYFNAVLIFPLFMMLVGLKMTMIG